MVEQALLNDIFKSLSDPTRRDILSRVCDRQQTISELAERYHMSFAAVAKHVKVLESAKLVEKRKNGKEQIVIINGASLEAANSYLQSYAKLWDERFNRLENMINKEQN